MTNKDFAKLDWFKKKCVGAGVQATKRQASKFRNSKGTVFALGRGGENLAEIPSTLPKADEARTPDGR